MRNRPITHVTYELELIGEGREIVEEFTISFDSELYDSDRESTDSMAVNMKYIELKAIHGDDLVLFSFSVSRSESLIH